MNKAICLTIKRIFLFAAITFSTFVTSLTIDSKAIFLASIKSQITIPDNYQTYFVSTSNEAYQALDKIKNHGGYGAVIFAQGRYFIPRTLNITTTNVMLLSQTANPFDTVLYGNGMFASKGVDNLIRVAADNFIIDGLTLEQAGNHLLQIAGEHGANKPLIRNSIFQNGYEQLIKVTRDRHKNIYSDRGIIEHCLFQYTNGIGPNYYIGGIDAHGIKNWLITNNIFENIASPSKHIAEHAIHLWNDTANNTIENNLIINSDRGIGFGMRLAKHNYNKYSNLGGIIQGNVLYHAANNHPFADVGIILEDSPETIIRDNLIYFEHNYPNAVEFRFDKTIDVLIINNDTNRSIISRNGAQATSIHNRVDKLNENDLILAIEKFKNHNRLSQ